MNANQTSTIFYKIKKYRVLLLMLLPTVLFYILFNYIPMVGVIIAFKRYTFDGGVFFSPWVGFDNFKFLFMSGDALRVTRNTVLYNAAFILVNNTLQIVCAILLAELAGRHFKKITQSLLFLPYFISWVVVGALAYNLFNFEFGSVNSMLKSWGMAPVDVYSSPNLWIIIIICVSAWKSLGYGMVIYLAAIMGIDAEMYEAADIDGANIFRKIFHITLPCLTPTIIILILLSIGNIFRGDFSMFYQLVGENSLLYPTTDVIDTFVTRSLLLTLETGMSAAAGLLQSVLGFVVVMVVNYSIKRYDKEYALF